MTRSQELAVVTQIAKQAADVAKVHYRRVARLEKTHIAADAEAVTAADRACQTLIVSNLRQHFPGDGIIGEEDDAGDGITFDVKDTSGRVWVIDPIDGTNNFIAGLGNFAVCIGLLEAGMPTLGVVLDVTRGDVYAGAEGVGAFLNDQAVEALSTPLGSSTLIMMTGFLAGPNGQVPDWAIKLFAQVKWKPRILGSAALDAVQVAAGVAHAAYTANGKLWDVAAPAAIVLAAGGKVTTPTGQPIFPFNLDGYRGAKVPFIAGAPNAHGEFVEYANK